MPEQDRLTESQRKIANAIAETGVPLEVIWCSACDATEPMKVVPDRAYHRCEACGNEVSDINLFVEGSRAELVSNEIRAAHIEAKALLASMDVVASMQENHEDPMRIEMRQQDVRRLLRLLRAFRNGWIQGRMSDHVCDDANFEERVNA